MLDVLPWKSVRVPAATPVTDMGDVTLMPGCINAHCHLQLSHTAGRTLFGAGFTAWLRSLIALLREEHDGTALALACRDMAAAGTAHVGDYAGDGLLAVDAAVRANGMGVTHFLRVVRRAGPLHRRRAPLAAALPRPAGAAARSGRALRPGRACPVFHGCPGAAGRAAVVPPDGAAFRAASGGIRGRDAPAARRRGPLWDCYRGMVLPEDWAVPHLRPVAYARRLGLLGPGTLAVHGVQLEPAEVEALAASGSALCLCPRSNEHLAVGTAPVASLLESGLLCCLGTDGLSSNTDRMCAGKPFFCAKRWTLPAGPDTVPHCERGRRAGPCRPRAT